MRSAQRIGLSWHLVPNPKAISRMQMKSTFGMLGIRTSCTRMTSRPVRYGLRSRGMGGRVTFTILEMVRLLFSH